MLLSELFPRLHLRYSSLPVLGPILEGYATWLSAEGYPRGRVLVHVRTARRLERFLHRRRVAFAVDLSRESLQACAPASAQDDPDMAVLVRLLMRYLEATGCIATAPAPRVESTAAAYGDFLTEVRGLSTATVSDHVATASRFLAHLASRTPPVGLRQIASPEIETFVAAASQGISRASLQHVVAQLRGLLRFLAVRGVVRSGLDSLIDSPRLYRGERLPRSLPWPTVEALLRSIDRTSHVGRRDYAMLLLIATYGLRTSDVAALKLDHVEWRARRIRVAQRKTRTPLILPLTDEVGAALVDYLRNGRPPLPLREVFLRVRAPAGILKPTAVTEVFQTRSRRSGLAIPWQGPHCIRHSFAVHLLRQGTGLKIIGDLLGHRSAEATCVYLRLALEDLRQVALPLPGVGTEGRP